MYIQHMFNKHNMECHHAGLHTITLHNMHTANVHVSTYTYNMDRYCACKMCMHNVRGVGGGVQDAWTEAFHPAYCPLQSG